MVHGQDKRDEMQAGGHEEGPHGRIEESKEAGPEGDQGGHHVEPKACHGQNIHGL